MSTDKAAAPVSMVTEPDSLRRIHTTLKELFPVHLGRCSSFLRQKSVSATGKGPMKGAVS